jgi:hypothetical protein
LQYKHLYGSSRGLYHQPFNQLSHWLTQPAVSQPIG